MQVYKSTGKMPKELVDMPECPIELLYIWEWYLELCAKDELTHTEIKSWSDISTISVTGFECKLLRMIDQLRFSSNG